MTSEIVLEGCAPIPLAGYLKALGVFRLVATQADPDARGRWQDERFRLTTKLSREELDGFLLRTYRPTPVISPWNAGSGFYYREEKAREKDPATGKFRKTGIRNQPTEATRALDAVVASKGERFEPYRQAIRRAKGELAAAGLVAAPGDEAKAALIRRLRSDLPDAVLDWIDAAATVTQGEVVFPPLLGSGGNDGNLDFSTTVLQRLAVLMSLDDGSPTEAGAALLAASIHGEVESIEADAAISQFAPGDIGSFNSGAGFAGSSTGNAWDVVLSLEGALVMATALVRRADADKGSASFPFMVPRRGVFGAGAGNIASVDENARGEFWAPVWRRPAAFTEILALFREGRAIVDRSTAGTALDFAQAVGRLGVDRGVEQFERYGFEQRNGNMYLGVPLDRRRVEANPHADLIADLARGNWLSRVRSAVRGKGAPASMLSLGRQLDEALFRLAADASHAAVQDALIAIGMLALEAGRRPKLRQDLPPPSLSSDWLADADDRSHAFAIARALATLAASAPAGEGKRFLMPFRRHLAPLEVRGAGPRRDDWADTTEARVLAVWTGRDALADMAAVLGRRLVEAQRRTFERTGGRPELPLRGWGASLAAVGGLVAGDVDLDRAAALAAGLAWVNRGRSSQRAVEEVSRPADDDDDVSDDEAAPEDEDGRSDEAAPAIAVGQDLPTSDDTGVGSFAFAALKPLFDPKGLAIPRPADQRRYGEDGDKRERKPIDPLPLLRLVESRRIAEAVSGAQRMARGAGLSVPFADAFSSSRQASQQQSPEAAKRLAAALLVPLSDPAMERLAHRAYPQKEESNAD